MANLTIKNMSDQLYHDLKASAARHHRSIANEAISILEQALWAPRMSEADIQRMASDSRARFTGPGLSMDETIAAIKEGRKYE